MAFKEQLQTGLDPVLQTENKKLKENHQMQLKTFLQTAFHGIYI
jgi:hypothetical protein